MDKIKICKACDIHIGRTITDAKDYLIPICRFCSNYNYCTLQYLANDNTVRTCFNDFWDRLISIVHEPPMTIQEQDLQCDKCRDIKNNFSARYKKKFDEGDLRSKNEMDN